MGWCILYFTDGKRARLPNQPCETLAAMITPHHLIYNSAIGQKFFPGIPTWVIASGALFPDIWVWVYYIWHHLIQGVPDSGLWGDLYFKSRWNGLFCLVHSFWLLPLCILLAAGIKNRLAVAFFASALFHAACDFLVHHDDSYRHFYPFSDWRFESPVSYWDPSHHGMAMSVATSAVSILCLFYLQKQTAQRWLRWGLWAFMVVDVLIIGSYLSAALHIM
jgi:hypothetical protein